MAQQRQSRNKNRPVFKKTWWRSWFLLFSAVVLLTVVYIQEENSAREIDWLTFEQKVLSKDAVEKVIVVNKEYAEIFIKPEFQNDSMLHDVLKPEFGKGIRKGPHYFLTIGSTETFERNFASAQQKFFNTQKIPITYINNSDTIWNLVIWLVPLFFFIVIAQYFLKRAGSGAGSLFGFGKSTALLRDKENKSTITFDDVAGLDEAEMEVKEIVDFLKNPSSFTRLGAKIPKGIILVGPPGTGKTLLAKAVAGEAQVPFYSISGSEFVEMFVGVGASRVRDLFKTAKEKTPCIIFIDEIDAIGRSRSRNAFFSGANDERESTLNQLLTEMDGFGTNSGVIVLAATNRADMLDPALLRPGRFDRHIYLELPNLKEREAIFMVHLRPLTYDILVDVHFLATQTPGFSGADIANICNEAALIAARRKKEKVGRQDFIDAIDRIIGGLEKKSKIISPTEKKIIAFHEAGHALISWILPSIDPLVKVSIIPRGKSLGSAWYLPEERQLRTASSFHERLCATLGGRAAEEVIFGEVSSGSLDDLEKVTKEAYMMVAYLGFDEKVGAVSFYDSTEAQNSAFQKPYSEETGKLIDEEVRKIVATAYDRAKKILTDNIGFLKELSELLLKTEVVYKEQIEEILGKRKNDSVKPIKILPMQSEG